MMGSHRRVLNEQDLASFTHGGRTALWDGGYLSHPCGGDGAAVGVRCRGQPRRRTQRRVSGAGLRRRGQWPDPPCPALTLKMRGRSLDCAWITSEARTGVAENWGSLRRSTELVRGHNGPGHLP